jgi:MFS family permease
MTRGDSVFWSAAAMFAMSVTGAIGNVECGTYLTENIADDMIGKISGVSYTMTIGACALGPVFGGFVVQESSIQDAVFILLIIVALMVLASLLVFKKSPHLASAEPETIPLPIDGRESPGLAPASIASLGWSDVGMAVGNRDVVIVRGDDSY